MSLIPVSLLSRDETQGKASLILLVIGTLPLHISGERATAPINRRIVTKLINLHVSLH